MEKKKKKGSCMGFFFFLIMWNLQCVLFSTRKRRMKKWKTWPDVFGPQQTQISKFKFLNLLFGCMEARSCPKNEKEKDKKLGKITFSGESLDDPCLIDL